jgi:hypothetical protein
MMFATPRTKCNSANLARERDEVFGAAPSAGDACEAVREDAS